MHLKSLFFLNLFVCFTLLGCVVPYRVAEKNENASAASPFEETSAKIVPPAQATMTSPAQPTAVSTIESEWTPEKLSSYCNKKLTEIPGNLDKASVQKACSQAQLLDNCKSTNGSPIFHYDRIGTDPKGKRVLTISLIHGDELPSGSVTRAWISRLDSIDPRNTWRMIPIVNPDGVKARTRYNANKVDLNRNFPSQDWDTHALKYWAQKTRKDSRRYPGPTAESEAETRCLVRHIQEFQPDFVISVHTPLGVLDFDGPKVQQPGFKPLPWVGLGNYSGSLGRYMWVDNKVPVLTIELKGNSGIKRLEDFDRLQDISGTVAIQSGKILEQEKR